MIYLRLFWEFFKTGLFAVGGGMATVPFLQDISAKTGWFTFGQLADMIAVSESTPGPIGVNMATYVGYSTGVQAYGVPGGILGAAVASLGLIMPSILVILCVAFFLDKYRQSGLVKNTMYGLRPASVALITAAGVEILLFTVFQVSDLYHLRDAVFSIKAILLFALIYVLTTWVPKVRKLHPVWFIGLSALLGIVFRMGQ